MKILCICAEGNVRSAALARELKHRGIETLAAGVNRHSPETLKMLMDWADETYVVQEELIERLPKGFRVRLFHLGEDIWKEANHPDLVKKISEMLKVWEIV